MKKIILLASALVLGGTAYAQDASMQPPASGSTMPSATDASTPPAASPDASAPAPMTPDASAPAPTGAPTTTPTPQELANLPMCSKTVTDSCREGTGSGHHAKHKMSHKASHKKHK